MLTGGAAIAATVALALSSAPASVAASSGDRGSDLVQLLKKN